MFQKAKFLLILFIFQFWSAYVPCGSQYLDSVQLTLEQIDVIIRLVERYPKYMQLATSAEGKI
jgi:membrane dipeptidase